MSQCSGCCSGLGGIAARLASGEGAGERSPAAARLLGGRREHREGTVALGPTTWDQLEPRGEVKPVEQRLEHPGLA